MMVVSPAGLTWRTSPPPASMVALNSLSELISSTVSTLATWHCAAAKHHEHIRLDADALPNRGSASTQTAPPEAAPLQTSLLRCLQQAQGLPVSQAWPFWLWAVQQAEAAAQWCHLPALMLGPLMGLQELLVVLLAEVLQLFGYDHAHWLML